MKTLLYIFISFCFLKAEGQKINTPLIYTVNKPKVLTQKTPVLIILHGYGSRETDSKEMAKMLQDKFLVFSLRAPYTTTAGAFCWFRMDFLPWKNFKSNYAETEASKALVLQFISNACKTFHADSNNVFIMGFSQGGMLAYDIALSAPYKMKGVLALSTRVMEETMVKPNLNWQQLQKVKFFIVGGYSDPVISFLDSYKAHDYLRNSGVQDLTIKLYDIPHTITDEEIVEMKKWLALKTIN